MTRRLLVLGVIVAGLVLAIGFQVLTRRVVADEHGNILRNAGFEEQQHGEPVGWTIEAKVRPKGTISLSTHNVHSGRFSLKLAPNAKNAPWDLTHDPLGVGQGFPAASFRGKRVYVSAWLAAEGDAVSVVDVLALGGRTPTFVELKQTSAKSGPVFREDVLRVPDDARTLIVVCIVQGTSGAAYADDLFVSTHVPASWGSGGAPAPSAARSGAATTAPLEAHVTIDGASDVRRIPSTLYGMNIEWIWDGNGIWRPESHSLDPEVVRLTRELHLSLLRFPGGILSDFYHWRDGVGTDRHPVAALPGERPQMPAFGTDEALEFAAQTGSQLLVTVNVGTGTAQEAADWVRYINHGRRRVLYWEVGNEIYVKGGQPAFVKATMPPEAYARKFLAFAQAMRQADPGIKIGAIGDENFGARSPRAYGDWTSKVLKIAGSQMDFLAVHDGYAPVLLQDTGQSLRRVYTAMVAAPRLVSRSLATAAAKIRAIDPDRASHIRLAVTEWGPYFQQSPHGRFVDHVKTLGSALYTAGALKAFIESPQTDIATGFKLVDKLFQGWIGRRQGHWAPTASYYALELYTRHFGHILLRSTTDSPTFDSQPIGLVDALSAVPYLDVVSSRSDDGHTLYVMAINRNFDRAIKTTVTLTGVHPAGTGVAWTLNGTGIDANTGTEPFRAPGVTWARQAQAAVNPRFTHGGPHEVTLTSAPLTGLAAHFTYTFPAHSVTALEVALR